MTRIKWSVIGPKILEECERVVAEHGLHGFSDIVARRFAPLGVTRSKLLDWLRHTVPEEWARVRHRALQRYHARREDQPPASELADRVLQLARQSPQTVYSLAEILDCSPRLIRDALMELADRGEAVQVEEDTITASAAPRIITTPAEIEWSGEVFRFCAISDTHLGSRYEQLQALRAIYAECEKRGIDTVFHSGDLVDGEKMYRGHEYEIHTHGADAQIDYVVAVYPQVKGITTHVIAGNHDWSFYRHAGIDVVHKIAKARPDFRYHGPISRSVQVRSAARRRGYVQIDLVHPSGGPAYARSYRLQKLAESYQPGAKPDIALVGHFHFQAHIFVRLIHMVQVPCLQAQTSYLREKGLEPVVGAYFFTVEFSKDGSIGRVIPELMTWQVMQGQQVVDFGACA